MDKFIERNGSPARRYYSGLDMEIETRAVDGTEEKQNVIKGYALKFEQKSSLLYGYFTEIIDKDALRGADMSETKCFFNHDRNLILGCVPADTLLLRVDNVGLYYEATLPATTYAQDLKVSIDRRDITGSSFAFSYLVDEWREMPDGTYERRVKEIDVVYDVSPVTFPAYKQSEVRCEPESFEKYLKDINNRDWQNEYEARQAIINSKF